MAASAAASPGPESSCRSPMTSPTERSFNKKRSSYQSTSLSYDNDNEGYFEDDVNLRRSSSSSNSTRGRRSQRDIPISPPSVGSDDDYYQNDEVREIRAENVLGNWHFAPLLIAIVPPLGAILGGGADAWSDAILLVIASFYLYQLLKVPHDIYHTARTRRILNSDANADALADLDEDPQFRRERLAAAAELRKSEMIALFALVASPVAGAWLLGWLMETFTDGNRFLNKFNIRLFMLASGIKPWSHAIGLFKKRLLHLHEVVHYPSSRVEFLGRKIGKLESELLSLRKLVATKQEVNLLRDGIDMPLTQLSRSMRRYERKEEHLRMSAEDKFTLLEGRLEDLLRETAINAELIEEERRQRQRIVSLPMSIFQALRFIIGSRTPDSAHRELLSYDAPRSLTAAATPLNLSNTPSNSPGGGEKQQNGNVANNGGNVSIMQASSSTDSLPGYSSPPRYPVSPITSNKNISNHANFNNRSKQSSTYQISKQSQSQPSQQQHSYSSPGWTEEGLAYWMFLPINIPKSVIRSALSYTQNRVEETKDKGYAQGYASVANHVGDHKARIAPSSKSPLAPIHAPNKARFNGSPLDLSSPRVKSTGVHSAGSHQRRA